MDGSFRAMVAAAGLTRREEGLPGGGAAPASLNATAAIQYHPANDKPAQSMQIQGQQPCNGSALVTPTRASTPASAHTITAHKLTRFGHPPHLRPTAWQPTDRRYRHGVVGTHSIDYVVTGISGLTSTSTRTVMVSAAGRQIQMPH